MKFRRNFAQIIQTIMKTLSPKFVAKVAAVAAFAVSGCFALMPSASANITSNSVPAEYDAQASIYRQHCAKCHGNDGHANTKEGRRTEADDLTEDRVKSMSTEKMTRIIKNGKGDMPAFGKKLTAAQISSLVGYVRSL